MGFELWKKSKEQYFTVLQKTDIVSETLKKLNIKPLSLFGRNYGGSIIDEILSRKYQV